MDGEIFLNLISLGDTSVCKTHAAVAKNLKADLIDLSFKDASIQTVYRLLIKFICENFNSSERYCAIIGIPTNKRLELREDTGKPIDFFDHNYFNFYPRSKDFPLISYSQLKKFNGQIFQKVLIDQRHSAFIFALENILECYNIEYVMYNLHETLDPSIKPGNRFLFPHDQDRFEKFARDPNKHKEFAKELSDFLNDNNS